MGRQILGQVGRIKEEKREEYIALHASPWPEIVQIIKECNMENYSIFIRGNLVFSYYEYTGEDYDADRQKLAKDVMVQKWWAITDPCFERYDNDSAEASYENMESIFYLK